MGVALQLYSRYQDGNLPVLVLNQAGSRIYQIQQEGQVLTFTSARSLLITLTGHPQARHWTFDRYFRQGRYASSWEPDHPTFLDLFSPAPPAGPPVSQQYLTIKTPLGIDLARRGQEVAKLLFAGYGAYLHRQGYDPEDVLQEVYKGILVRNQGRCAWDPAKSSFGHYVHMVCGCVLSNYHRRQGRRRTHEQVGLPEREQAGPSPDLQEASLDLGRYITSRGGQAQGAEEQLTLQLLPLVIQGCGRTEIATRLGLSKPVVTRGLRLLRELTGQWAA